MRLGMTLLRCARNKLFPLREANDGVHAAELGFQEELAIALETIIAAAGVAARGCGTVYFLNEGEVEKALERSVKRAGAHLKFAGREGFCFLHDGVAVFFALSESKEDVEDCGSERKEALKFRRDFGLAHEESSPRYISR